MISSRIYTAPMSSSWNLLVTTLLVVATTAPATAQRFKEMKPQIGVRDSKMMRLAVTKAMRDPAEFQANRQVLDDYFTKFYFPAMTLQSYAGQLGKLRENLFKQFIRPARVQAAQDHLTELTFTAMRVIARDNYHPAARYNAVLILGMLDEKVAGAGTGANPPVPLPAATNDLLELLEQDEFNGVKVPASLKIGALVGLERHARFGIDAQYADRLTKAALAVISLEQPPADLDIDVHHWMQCQAAGVLARQFAKAPNAQVQDALTRMIADGNLSLEDRCCVAGLLKEISYEGANGIDSAATVAALGRLIKSVASDEAKLARDFQQEILNPPRASFREGNVGPMYERRRLLTRINSVSDGANALTPALPDAARQQVENLSKALAPVAEVASDKNSLDLDITGKVIDMESAVNSVVDSWSVPAEAPAQPAEGES